MGLGRRWPAFCVLALTSIFLLYSIPLHSTTSGLNYHTPVQYVAPSKTNDGRFRWSDLQTRYPPSSLISLPSGLPQTIPVVQYDFTISPETKSQRETRLQRQQSVKDSFLRCWSSYKQRAWMKDELSPITGGGQDHFGGWAATLVDSLDTLYIMDLKDEMNVAIDAVGAIDFTTSTETQTNIFETTIRYLGGFLSAYDLSGDRRILDKAVEIGEMLYVAFDTPNRMPVTRWDWVKAAGGGEQEASLYTLVSEIGSLSLEFTRLSQVTGNPKWFDAVQRITDVFDSQQSQTKLPGMWPVIVNARDKNFTQDTGFTLGGMADSLYEYFPKQYALLGGLSPVYRKLYEESVSTAIKYNFFRPMVPNNENILISGNIRADSYPLVSLDPQGQHLGCFTGGMLALGGRLFENPDHVWIGRKLVDGCIWAYNSMPLGIMPETFQVVPCKSIDSCTWDPLEYKSAVLANVEFGSPNFDEVVAQSRLPPGFTAIRDKRYILRPEAIESIFILYRVTGDTRLQEQAWKMFTTIQNLTETEFANAALDDVTVTDGMPPKSDRMESFWMAETLKYFYLIFSEPDLISLDDYVFNTEAHPLRRPGRE